MVAWRVTQWVMAGHVNRVMAGHVNRVMAGHLNTVMAGHVNTVMAGHVNTVMRISVAQQTNFFPLCTIYHAVTQTVEALHPTTSRKVAVWIPVDVTGNFHYR